VAISETSLRSQVQNAVAFLDNLFAAQTIATDQATVVAGTAGPLAKAKLEGAEIVRALVAQAIGSAQLLLGANMIDYSTEITLKPERDVLLAIGRLFDYFHANNISVESRVFDHGTWTTFGSSKGELSRLSLDEFAYGIEATFTEKRTLRCIADQSSGGRRFAEVFALEGSANGPDILDIRGSGASTNLTVASALNSGLSNSTFAQYSWTTAPAASTPATGVANDEVTDWTLGDPTDHELDVDLAPHTLPGITTPVTLRFNDNGSLSQKLSVSNAQVDLNSPYKAGFWIYRESSCDGTLTLAMGSTTKAVAMSTFSNSTWTWFELDDDEDLWPGNWLNDEAAVSLTLASRTTGTFVCSNPHWGPMSLFDGLWYFLPAGTSPHLLDDEITATSSIASDSKIQKHLAYAFGAYLPHRASVATITAAGGRTLTFATGPDTITASTGSFVTDGYVVGMKVVVAGTSSNDGTYSITAVAALVLTVSETLTAEGPLSATATLDGTPTIPDPS